MSDEYDPPSVPPPFDLGDPEIRRWLAHLRVAFEDLDAVFQDSMRPLRRRRLGHVQHQELYREAREAIVAQLDAVLRPPVRQGGGDPSAH